MQRYARAVRLLLLPWAVDEASLDGTSIANETSAALSSLRACVHPRAGESRASAPARDVALVVVEKPRLWKILPGFRWV